MNDHLEYDDDDLSKVWSLCRDVFKDLDNIGGRPFAKRVFRSAFGFGYDDEQWPVVPDNLVVWLLTHFEGTRESCWMRSSRKAGSSAAEAGSWTAAMPPSPCLARRHLCGVSNDIIAL